MICKLFLDKNNLCYPEQNLHLRYESGAVPSLVNLASSRDTDPEVKNEACWVVLNATSCGSDLQIEYLVQQGCVEILGELLGESSMVMMALEGLERILQVGDEEAKHLMGGNPYAKLLSSSRIEELEKHKSTAISKRASRIWKQHFVTCEICKSSYSRLSSEARFCDECKCHVCSNCNCTVFHLSYQEELWRELTETEWSAKQKSAEMKRAKKQKKKKKDKDKKKEKNIYTSDAMIGYSHESMQTVDNRPKDIEESSACIAVEKRPSNSTVIATGRRKRSSNKVDSKSIEEERGSTRQLRDCQSGASDTSKMTDTVENNKDSGGDDVLVSYLQQTGSILKLAEMLDDGPDDDDVTEADILALQEAAAKAKRRAI